MIVEARIVVTGMPGSGKSTVTRRIAERLPRAVRLRADDIQAMITSGGVWALGELAEEAKNQVQLVYRNLGSLASNFADAGFVPVIDTVIPDRAHLDGLRNVLAPRAIALIVLNPGISVSRERNERRKAEERWEFTGYEDLNRTMRGGFGSQGWWLDTSDLTADQTASRIVDGYRANALVTGNR